MVALERFKLWPYTRIASAFTNWVLTSGPISDTILNKITTRNNNATPTGDNPVLDNPKQLREVADQIRRRDLVLIHQVGLGHIGGDLSVVDLLVTLYFSILRIDPNDPKAPGRDRFVLSKGHCSGAFYHVLAEAGFFATEELQSYIQPLSRLNGHPANTKLPGVEASTGPLGHGLPIAVGMALAAKLGQEAWRTFVVTGDGELQEGSNWEAAMAASHFQLDNLTLIVDRNRLQQGDWTEKTMSLDPLATKWEAFGWAVREVDGHDFAAMLELFNSLPFEPGKPNAVIAHTHKGKGVSFIEDHPGWHHRVPTAAELTTALAELNGATHE
jgi:transketolase